MTTVIKKKRLTREQAEALKKYKFALSEEDRYLGSVFVTRSGHHKYEDAVDMAYEACKKLGLGYEHGL